MDYNVEDQTKALDEILRYRSFFKLVSQISWTIGQTEKSRPNIQSLMSDELEQMLRAYKDNLELLKTNLKHLEGSK